MNPAVRIYYVFINLWRLGLRFVPADCFGKLYISEYPPNGDPNQLLFQLPCISITPLFGINYMHCPAE